MISDKSYDLLQEHYRKREGLVPKKGEIVVFRDLVSLAVLVDRLQLGVQITEFSLIYKEQDLFRKKFSNREFLVKEDLQNPRGVVRVFETAGKTAVEDVDLLLVKVSMEEGDLHAYRWYWWRFTNPRIDRFFLTGSTQLELF